MEIIEIKEFPREVLKKKILEIMSDGKTRWIDEISTKLSADFIDVLKAFKELEAEDKLFIDSDMMKRA